MWRFFLLLSLVIALPTAKGSAVSDNKKQLQHIQHSIADIQAELSEQQQLRESNEKKLKKTETSMAHLLTQMRTTQQKLSKQQKRLKQLNHQNKIYQQRIKQQKIQLAQQIRAAYRLPNTSLLRLLLDANHMTDIDRMRQYSYYLSQDPVKQIKQLKRNIHKLAVYQQETQKQSNILLKLTQKQQQQHQKLNTLKQSREKIVKAINSKILTKQERLALLNQQKHQLESTLMHLQKKRSRLSRSYFDHLKGKLTWPIHGKLHNRYGSNIDQSELTRNGVVIEAAADEPVHAIANGKVVFANWMSGYGLLLIVEHGNGYMSLYGRNQNLYKKVGDSVHKGEVISLVGQSGGYKKPELYFEIRHNAKPQDPTIWCQ